LITGNVTLSIGGGLHTKFISSVFI